MNHAWKKVGVAAATIAMLGASLAGCSHNSSDTASNGPVTISFWHSASGASAEAVDQVVKDFNEKNKGKIKIDSIYQGSYGDAIAKLANSVQSGKMPDVMQVNDANTIYMRDTGIAIPAEDLNKAADTKTDLKGLVPAVGQYYTIDGKLLSMPFMTSTPVLYINPDMAAKAGLDANNPPKTRAELIDWAKKIHAATGKPGLVFHVGAWWFEEWTASDGLEYCTPKNGVGKKSAEKFVLSDPKQVQTWKDFRELYKNGDALDVGSDSNNAQTAFATQEAGMTIQSSSSLGNLQENSQFKPVTAAFPVDNTKDGGIVIGGNSLWVFGKDAKDAKAQAAWKFVTYMASPEAQKVIFDKSGYLPGTEKSLKAVSEGADPVHKVLLDQLADVKASTVTAGCHSGAIQQVREALGDTLTSILHDGTDPQQALTALETKSQTMVADYQKRASRHK
ncbi:MAG: ABC transporter substrate-binding protein [Actinomycetaceae bacterium]|nr:ABC transporter substrate-binding protein [Actinomycetaceae bacterium]MDU0971242.1 ABC transporter substrate-binding protein [Actinomycetaceae bacterium]